MTDTIWIKSAGENSDVFSLRRRVFCEETGLDENLVTDRYDLNAENILLTDDNEPVACGRLYTDENGNTVADNIAVIKSKRNLGFGSAVILGIISRAKADGVTELKAEVPENAVSYFEKFGFCVNGAGYAKNTGKYFHMERDFIFDNSGWLCFDKSMQAVLTRSKFNAENIESAILEITSLGFFESYVNGKKISDDINVPAMSDYEKRDLTHINMPIFDTFTHRLYYMTYDISDLINDGGNTLACHIGSGWYGQKKSTNEGINEWGELKLVYKLTLCDGDGNISIITSDTKNTKWRASYIKETNIYYGEYHDMTLYPDGWTENCFDDSQWLTCNLASQPLTLIKNQFFPADRCEREIKPVKISSFGDRAIYDLGELISGYAVIRFIAPADTNSTAIVRYADELNPDGSLQFHYCGGKNRMQQDYFIFNRWVPDELLYPHFTWHAARYVEITGDAEFICYRVIQSDIMNTSAFTSGNDTLNWIYDAYIRTQKENIHCCVPSDCPHRERLGYTGDGQLTCGAVMTCFDARLLYKKWIRDIADSQDIYNGHVQHTAPFYGGGGGPGGWGGAMVIVPYRYYKFYGDKKVLAEYFNSMLMYLKYMQSRCEDDIITHEEKGGWSLGDWCPLHNEIKLPESFVNTYFFIKTIDETTETAEILGKTEYVQELKDMSATARQAFIRHFFNNETGSFIDGEQGADAFAIDIGLGDERTLKNLVKKYSEIKTYDTGIFGTDIVTRILFEKGYPEIALALLINEEETSFYNMKKHGATTLWENWDGCDSRCHPMFGAVLEYYFSYILGIRRYEDRPTYRDIVINPAALPSLNFVRGTMSTPDGDISVQVDYKDGKQNVNCTVSGNITVHTV